MIMTSLYRQGSGYTYSLSGGGSLLNGSSSFGGGRGLLNSGGGGDLLDLGDLLDGSDGGRGGFRSSGHVVQVLFGVQKVVKKTGQREIRRAVLTIGELGNGEKRRSSMLRR